MRCDRCGAELPEGSEVEMLVYGNVVGGKFAQSEPESVAHADGACPDEEDEEG